MPPKKKKFLGDSDPLPNPSSSSGGSASLSSAPIAPPPTTPSPAARPDQPGQLTANLPDSLSFKLPDFGALQPDNLFLPSTSPIPRTPDIKFSEDALAAHEQGNSLKLLELNLTNLEQLGKNAVIATRIGKLEADFQLGMEAIRTGRAKLEVARQNTTNESIRTQIAVEKGVQLQEALAGERLKTQIETAKNDLTTLDLQGYQQMKTPRELEWQNKIASLKAKAEQALLELGKPS